jgi:hypothetical protein
VHHERQVRVPLRGGRFGSVPPFVYPDVDTSSHSHIFVVVYLRAPSSGQGVLLRVDELQQSSNLNPSMSQIPSRPVYRNTPGALVGNLCTPIYANPGGALALALSTPLTVWLTRTAMPTRPQTRQPPSPTIGRAAPSANRYQPQDVHQAWASAAA